MPTFSVQSALHTFFCCHPCNSPIKYYLLRIADRRGGGAGRESVLPDNMTRARFKAQISWFVDQPLSPYATPALTRVSMGLILRAIPTYAKPHLLRDLIISISMLQQWFSDGFSRPTPHLEFHYLEPSVICTTINKLRMYLDICAHLCVFQGCLIFLLFLFADFHAG